MSIPLLTDSPLGQRTETIWTPPYSRDDFAKMEKLLDDYVMNGWAAVRLIHDDRITVTTVGN